MNEVLVKKPTIKERLALISQLGIPVFSLYGTYLISEKNPWGTVFCLLAQPFWLYSSAYTRQWGAFLTSIAFTGMWVNGIYKWFWNP